MNDYVRLNDKYAASFVNLFSTSVVMIQEIESGKEVFSKDFPRESDARRFYEGLPYSYSKYLPESEQKTETKSTHDPYYWNV